MPCGAPETLILTHNTVGRGGAYYRGLNLGRGLAARGHQVTLMGIAPSARWRFSVHSEGALQIVHSPDLFWGIGRTGWDPWDTLRRTLWLRRRRFDIVYAIDTRPAVVLPALAARRMHGGQLVIDWTDWWGRGGASVERASRFSRTVMGPIELYFEERFRPHADLTVAISRALADRAESLGIPREEILLLPTGCDVEALRPLSKSLARERRGLDPDRIYLGYLGNIYPADARMLVEAVRQVRHRPEPVLVMIGGAALPDDDGLAAAGRLIEAGHLSSYQEMGEYLAACDALLLPLTNSIANRGRWPSKINDYLAAGRPVVASAVGDLVDVFEHHDIGYATGPSAADLAAGIDALLADPERCRTLGENARRLAETELSSANTAERLDTALRQLLDRKGGSQSHG